MELLLFLLILTTASSSVISAGNDTNLTSTALPDITLSPWSVDSKTVQTEKTVSSTVSSQHKDVMITNHTSTTVSTTTAPLSSRHTGGTDGSSLSSSNSTPEVQTEKTESSTVSSQHKDVMINNHTSTTVSTTTAPLSSRHTGGTDGSSLSSSNSTPVGAYERPMTSTTVISNISMPEMTATPSQAPDSSLTLLAFGVMSLILILIVVMVILVTAINIRGRCKDTRQHKGIKSYDSVVLDSNVSSNCEKESITLVSVRTINTENNTDSPQISSVHSTIVDNEDQELTRDLLGIKDGV